MYTHMCVCVSAVGDCVFDPRFRYGGDPLHKRINVLFGGKVSRTKYICRTLYIGTIILTSYTRYRTHAPGDSYNIVCVPTHAYPLLIRLSSVFISFYISEFWHPNHRFYHLSCVIIRTNFSLLLVAFFITRLTKKKTFLCHMNENEFHLNMHLLAISYIIYYEYLLQFL